MVFKSSCRYKKTTWAPNSPGCGRNTGVSLTQSFHIENNLKFYSQSILVSLTGERVACRNLRSPPLIFIRSSGCPSIFFSRQSSRSNSISPPPNLEQSTTSFDPVANIRKSECSAVLLCTPEQELIKSQANSPNRPRRPYTKSTQQHYQSHPSPFPSNMCLQKSKCFYKKCRHNKTIQNPQCDPVKNKSGPCTGVRELNPSIEKGLCERCRSKELVRLEAKNKAGRARLAEYGPEYVDQLDRIMEKY